MIKGIIIIDILPEPYFDLKNVFAEKSYKMVEKLYKFDFKNKYYKDIRK